MSDPTEPEPGTPQDGEPATAQEPLSAGPFVASPPSDEAVFAALAGGDVLDDEAWPSRPRRSGVRMRIPTLVLVLLVVAAGAFWIGAQVQKSDGTATNPALVNAASRIASIFRRAGAAGFPGAGTTGSGFGATGAPTPAATGTVTAVVGNTLYLTSPSGSIVKVQLSPSTTIDRNAKVTPGALRSGDTVVVEGTKGASGAVNASSIADTAKGVASAGAGSLGGSGGGAGASGTGGFGG